jgi:hypothetical protein
MSTRTNPPGYLPRPHPPGPPKELQVSRTISPRLPARATVLLFALMVALAAAFAISAATGPAAAGHSHVADGNPFGGGSSGGGGASGSW